MRGALGGLTMLVEVRVVGVDGGGGGSGVEGTEAEMGGGGGNGVLLSLLGFGSGFSWWDVSSIE